MGPTVRQHCGCIYHEGQLARPCQSWPIEAERGKWLTRRRVEHGRTSARLDPVSAYPASLNPASLIDELTTERDNHKRRHEETRKNLNAQIDRLEKEVVQLETGKDMLEKQLHTRLSESELRAACANVGIDIACGRCAGIFYTGSALGQHDDDCSSTAFPPAQKTKKGKRRHER